MQRAAVGPTGWATIANGPRERVNINSRGCVELIRASTRIKYRMNGPYHGWCTCRPTSQGDALPLGEGLVELEVPAAAWKWTVWMTDQRVRVARRDDAGVNANFDFDLAAPQYAAPTQGLLEVERKRIC